RSRCSANQYRSSCIAIGIVLFRGRFSGCHISLFQIWFRFASGMSKKSPKSITERINELVNRLGELPPPSISLIKGRLLKIRRFVKALEKGAGIREAESKIENLELQLQTVNSEIKRFRAEQKEREKKER